MKILIVDDHPVVRHGLKSAIQAHGYEVVAVAASVNEARAFMAQLNPDAVIVDINLPDGSGLDLVTWSKKVCPSTVIIVLTLNDGADYAIAAKNAGANAFVIKNAPVSDLLAALDFGFSSPDSFSSKHIQTIAHQVMLSARELDVLISIDKGFSNAAIADTLFISVSTVKSHVSSILQKLEAGNRIQAINTARQMGLLI